MPEYGGTSAMPEYDEGSDGRGRDKDRRHLDAANTAPPSPPDDEDGASLRRSLLSRRASYGGQSLASVLLPWLSQE